MVRPWHIGKEYTTGKAEKERLDGVRQTTRQVVQYLDGDLKLPELSPTYQSFNMLAWLQRLALLHLSQNSWKISCSLQRERTRRSVHAATGLLRVPVNSVLLNLAK